MIVPLAGAPVITTATARTMAQSRWEAARRAIGEAVLREIQPFATAPVTTPLDAYAYVVSKQAVALVDSDKPRMDDVRTLGELMGHVETAADRGRDAPNRRVEYGVDAETRAFMLAILAARDNNNYREHDAVLDAAVDADADTPTHTPPTSGLIG